MKRNLLLTVVLAFALAACGGGDGGGATGSDDTPSSAPRMTWGEREPVIYSVVVAEVLDDTGTAPPTVYVVDSICAEGGQVKPSELACSAAIPTQARQQLQQQLERYTSVEFVDAPEAAVDADGQVKGGGLLFWFGPVKERANGEIRVGANYATVLDDDRAGGVNLAMEDQAGSWVVTGAAGLGGCPA